MALDIDATELLPKDDASQGFDNVAVGNLSPTLLDRYITVAQKVSRLAVGAPRRSPGGDTFRVRADLAYTKATGLTLAFIVGFVVVWWFITRGTAEQRLVQPLILPSPMEVVKSFVPLHFEQLLT